MNDGETAKQLRYSAKRHRDVADLLERIAEGKQPSRYDLNARVVILVDRNPRHRGSDTYEIFEIYENGMTVLEFYRRGGREIDLKADIEREHVRLDR